MNAFTEGTAKEDAWNDFALARQLGVAGFPSLFLTDQQRMLLLTYGHRSLADIETILAAGRRRFEESGSAPASQ